MVHLVADEEWSGFDSRLPHAIWCLTRAKPSEVDNWGVSKVPGVLDGLAVIEGLCGLTVQACMPPAVPVPKPGPCPGKRGPGGAVKKAVKKAVATPKAPRSGATPKAPKTPKAPQAPQTAPAGTPPGVAALPRTPGKPENANKAAKNTNPLFGLTGGPRQPTYPAEGRVGQKWTPELGPLTSGAFEENCTNVTLAWDMRIRGYDVQAAPIDLLDKYGYATGRTFEGVDQLLADAYRLPDGSPHGRIFFGKKGEPAPPWRSFDDIDQEIERDWPEGGRGIIAIAKHVFNVAKVNGKARYIEAQSDEFPSRTVTSQYKRRFRAHAPAYRMAQEGKLIRVDDLVPADGILESVRTKEQNREYADQQEKIYENVPARRYIEETG